MDFTRDVVIVGGCGHVGLPLGIAFAESGLSVTLFDTNQSRVDQVRAAKMPFLEAGADEALERRDGRRAPGGQRPNPRWSARPSTSSSWWAPRSTSTSTPDPNVVPSRDRGAARRSPRRPAPGPAQHRVPRRHRAWSSGCWPGPGVAIDVSFCPERIAEGKALDELRELAPDRLGAHAAGRRAGPDAVRHAHRVDRRARGRGSRAGQAVHQHLALHQVRGRQPAVHDRQRLRRSTSSASAPRCSTDYPRAADMPGPGFAAGPCLLKDTMQLAAFNNNNFTLGHASDDGQRGPARSTWSTGSSSRYDLATMTVGHPRHGVQGRVRRHPRRA